MKNSNVRASNDILEKLNSYRSSVTKLICMEDEVNFWKTRMKCLKDLDLPPESEANINVIIDDLIVQIELGLRKCLCLRAECIYIIEELSDCTIKQIMYLRYISGLSFEKIAERISYCKRHVTRLHNKGVELLTQKGSD